MDEIETEPLKQKKKIDTGLLVGLAAIFISIATLIVYIYQARIMQSQQYASVWPRVEWSSSNIDGVYIQVHNKGIGPALINDAKLKVDGKNFDSLNDVFTELIGQHDNMPFVTSYIGGRVMAPGEEFKLFVVTDQVYAQKLDSAFRVRQFEMEICYCSIYNECWISEGIAVREGTCR